MDKSITSMTGQCCYMPIFDCNVSLPLRESVARSPSLKNLLPRVELALIQEDAYKRLYSNNLDQFDAELGASVCHLVKKLDDWAQKYHDLVETNSTKTDTVGGPLVTVDLGINIALTYHFHITRLMVHRPGVTTSDRRQCWEDAVTCVQLLQRLSADAQAETGLVVLRQ